MWRIAASMGLMFFAVAWSGLAVMVVFLIVPSLWEWLFGPSRAAYGAMAALGLMVWASAKMMRLADRLISDQDHRRPGPPALEPVEQEVPADWRDYTASIVRSKRLAFYRRTRQFDRLAALERDQGSGDREKW
jgi:hypothetical protein